MLVCTVNSDFVFLRLVVFYSLDSPYTGPRLLDHSPRAGKHGTTNIPV